MKRSLFRELPARVRIVEVGPRDGLQNQPAQIPVALKAEWIRRLAACGLPEIEVTSFVNPKWVPQLADAEELVKLLAGDLTDPAGGTLYSALVPNIKGLERALAGGVRRIALFIAASETFSQKNTNCSIADSLERCREVFGAIAAIDINRKIHVRAYLSTAFHCPYEGRIDAAKVAALAAELYRMGAKEIAVSDTIGRATPLEVLEVMEKTLALIPREAIALHFHDTRGLALTNVVAGLDCGVATFDSSAGGLGGCPYAPGATGNLATEDLVYLLTSLNIQSGVDLDALLATSLWFEKNFAAPFPSRMLAARRGK